MEQKNLTFNLQMTLEIIFSILLLETKLKLIQILLNNLTLTSWMLKVDLPYYWQAIIKIMTQLKFWQNLELILTKLIMMINQLYVTRLLKKILKWLNYWLVLVLKLVFLLMINVYRLPYTIRLYRKKIIMFKLNKISILSIYS